LYTGLAINTCGTAFPHPLGYILTENYGVPHGKACAVFLPPFLERAHKFEPTKLAELLVWLGVDLTGLCTTITELTGLPKIHITQDQAARYAERWVVEAPKNFSSSPGGLTAKDAQDLLAKL
jgi:alcohol dehydrogenase class IV